MAWAEIQEDNDPEDLELFHQVGGRGVNLGYFLQGGAADLFDMVYDTGICFPDMVERSGGGVRL